ncbi:hypothetical protein HNS38_06360 [Lentimicrobium sp. L6]|uniref:hypothetical protein n=1 Tax=Lentimicrobium sp. L6 TaxID=2735916 RepID=UPI001552E7C7|nr:hypothetical protein [Lentimicrobium sp. L6]NPD84371.1 hypothetical protein [Lentimicrobium sp. L6]
MERSIQFIVRFYNRVHQVWENQKTHSRLATLLVLSFLISLGMSLFLYLGLVPENLEYLFPKNIFQSIQISFSLLLLIEVVGLVFTLSNSVSSSLVKQLEILSLILLRSAFKQFGEFYEQNNWADFEPVISMLSDAFGAMAIFIIILLINKTLKHTPITDDPESQTRFIMFKKVTSLILFMVFLTSGIYDIILYLQHSQAFDFFKNFYTILIFADIFLVLLSLRYNYSYIVVFRNSAFAVATIIIRMALSAPIYYNIGLGILASLFVLGVSFFYTKYRHCSSDVH